MIDNQLNDEINQENELMPNETIEVKQAIDIAEAASLHQVNEIANPQVTPLTPQAVPVSQEMTQSAMPQEQPQPQTMQVNYITTRQSVAILVIRLIGLALVMLLILFLFNFLRDSVSNFMGKTTTDVFGTFFGFLLYMAISFFLLLQWRSIEYTIYPDKIIFHSGIIARNKRVIEINMYKSVAYRKGLLGRLFGYGTIELDYLGTGLKFDRLENVPEPEHYLESITHLITMQEAFS